MNEDASIGEPQSTLLPSKKWLVILGLWICLSLTFLIFTATFIGWFGGVAASFIAYIVTLLLVKKVSPLFFTQQRSRKSRDITWLAIDHLWYVCSILGFSIVGSLIFTFTGSSPHYVATVYLLLLPGSLYWMFIHMQPQQQRDEASAQWAFNLGWNVLVYLLIGITVFAIAVIVIFLSLASGGTLDGN